MLLSQEARERIEHECAKYPVDQRRSAVMAALAIAQDEHRWLFPQLLQEIADYIGMPAIAVEEVATFYSMYNLGPNPGDIPAGAPPPVGKYKISVCTNLPCALSGAEQAAAHLKRQLGIDFKQTTADGQFTLIEAECMGACGDAPVMLVNNKRMCSWMSNDKIDTLLEELKK